MTQEQQRASVKIAKPFMNDEIIESIVEILHSGFLVQGKFVNEFESRLAKYLGCKNVIAVNSGTAALHISIQAVREKKDESKKGSERPEVITSPLSFAATANAILHAGCIPVFADVNEDTFNIDPILAEEKINERTIALEPVDVYGLPAEPARFKKISKSRDIMVVEDAAEAIGASSAGNKIGSISDLTCFSTYATKNLHTGEGGFVSTNDEELAQKLAMLRSQGQASRYNHKALGYNYRMLEFVAAIGLPQIGLIDELNARRRKNAILLKERLEKIESIKFQEVKDVESHAWYMFSMLLEEKRAGMNRDTLVKRLREQGIEADISWPTPIHLQPYYKNTFGLKEGDYPNSERICRTIFQLPIQPFLTQEEVERIAGAVKSILN